MARGDVVCGALPARLGSREGRVGETRATVGRARSSRRLAFSSGWERRWDVARLLTGVLICSLVLCGVVLCADAAFQVTKDGVTVWEAPSGGWKMGTKFMTRDLGALERFMENKPPEVEAGKVFEVMLAERGVWMGFSIKLGRVQKVVFNKSTKVVLIDKAGKRYESDGCFFYPDVMQTRVYDSRRMAVIVSDKTVLCDRRSGQPMIEVRFRDGEFRLKDLVEFEVVGAVEDTAQRVTR